MSSGSGSTTVATSAAGNSPFTMSQWQELEHQALIYKYLIAGLPVPPDLVLPIQKSFQMLSSPFLHHSPLGYCSMFGKKVDPEPGRCRRTDGKKWRCSKEAYPDSKYCERHMHRGRSRSRKPVESHSLSSSASGLASSNSGTGAGAGGGTGSYQNLPLGVFGSGSGTDQTQLQLDSIPYAIPSKDYARYLQGLNKPEVGEHSSFSESSIGDRASSMYSTVGNTSWPIPSTRYSPSKPADISMLRPTDYSQNTFLNCDFGLSQPGKQQHASQNLLPFFELTSSKNSWSGQEHERVNQGSFSVPQFSISGPMVSSDFLSSSTSPKEH